MKLHKKNNTYFWRTNKGYLPTLQWISQPEPLNNHQPRRGTRRKPGAIGCQCEFCSGVKIKNELKNKDNNKDFKKQIEDCD